MKEYKTYEDAIDVVKRILEMYDNKISELLSNDKMIKSIVTNINKERSNRVSPAKKELARIVYNFLDCKTGEVGHDSAVVANTFSIGELRCTAKSSISVRTDEKLSP